MEGLVLVLILRLLIPLTIFRWPLIGAIFSIVADFYDFAILQKFGSDLNIYQPLDKILDLYYLSIEAYVVLSWANRLLRNLGLFLYAYRALGAILYELTSQSYLLLIFPNIFEGFFLIYLLGKAYLGREVVIPLKRVIFILLILVVQKLYQEYYLHVARVREWPDTMTWLNGIFRSTTSVFSGG